MLLRLDDYNTTRGYAPVAKFDHTIFDLLRQRRAVRAIESQVDCGCDLVDVLTAGTLRAYRSKFDVVDRNRYFV